MVRSEQHLRLRVWKEQILPWRQYEEPVVRVKHDLYEIGQEFLEQTTGICAFFQDPLLIHENYLDMFAQIGYLA